MQDGRVTTERRERVITNIHENVNFRQIRSKTQIKLPIKNE
jgi:hypothetical protein